jgi:hypothetical protein
MGLNAINKNGGVVNVNDHVTIIAKYVSTVSGTNSTATVTVQAPLDAGTFNIQANDCFSVEGPVDANHPLRGLQGNAYGVVGDDLTVLGVVTAISGSGINALLTVKLITSQNSIVTAAGNCASDNV